MGKILRAKTYYDGMLRSICKKSLFGKVKVRKGKVVCVLRSNVVGTTQLHRLLVSPANKSWVEPESGIRIAQ